MSCGIACLTPALVGLSVAEYLRMIVKKAVVGPGHADKEQVAMMVSRLLPGCSVAAAAAADALPVAVCHANNVSTGRWWSAGVAAADRTRVAQGTRVQERVELRGRRLLKKKTITNKHSRPNIK